MQPLILVHSNDIHGRVEGLAQIATLIARIRHENPATPILYLDLGDVEDTAFRLSNLTRGVAMHRLLSLLGCAAAAVGNGGMMRYGQAVLAEYARAASYPLLLANLREANGNLPPGVQPSALIAFGPCQLGLVGVTDPARGAYAVFGMHDLPLGEVVREHAAALRQNGADAVFVLSHGGLANDRLLADEVQHDVALILGAHSHDVLPEGEWHNTVLIAQAGKYAQHVGRIDLRWDGDELTVAQVAVLPIDETVPPDAQFLAEAARLEAEAEAALATVIGELAAPLDFSTQRECGVGNLLADVLRERMGAEVALVAVGQAFKGPLPGGPLQQIALWNVCDSSANPGVVELSGAQLLALVERGFDQAFAAERPLQLRGAERGLFHLSGASYHHGELLVGGAPVDAARSYRVAGSDWELEPYGGYAAREWALAVKYDMPTILREAIEDYLRGRGVVTVAMGRT